MGYLIGRYSRGAVIDTFVSILGVLIAGTFVIRTGMAIVRGLGMLSGRVRRQGDYADQMISNLLGTGGGMPIYQLHGVERTVGDICENAIANNNFRVRARTPDGAEVVSIRSPRGSYLAVVEFRRSDPLPMVLIKSVYAIGSEGEIPVLKNLLAARGARTAEPRVHETNSRPS